MLKTFKCSPEWGAANKAKAASLGLGESEFIRLACDAYGTPQPETIPDPAVSAGEPNGRALSVINAGTGESTPIAALKNEPRHHHPRCNCLMCQSAREKKGKKSV